MLYTHQFNISDSSRQKLTSDILQLYGLGGLCWDVPLFQTYPILFDRQENHWIDLKQEFLNAVHAIKKPSSFKCRSWAYINIPGIKVSNHLLWHNHNVVVHKEFPQVISGIFYLSLPEHSNTTEYLINNQIKKIPPIIDAWALLPGYIDHRPGYWDHARAVHPRISVVADYYF